MFEIHKDTLLLKLQKHCSKWRNLMLMMEMNNHALCRKAMPCSGQNRNVGLKMLKLYIMLKTHNQNEGTESTNVILKIRTQMQ